jgi:hypothetical protein
MCRRLCSLVRARLRFGNDGVLRIGAGAKGKDQHGLAFPLAG